MSTWMVALKTSVLDGRAIGRWRVWLLADFPYMYPGIRQKKVGEVAGKIVRTAAGALAFIAW
jgi:hypothetical protein